MSATNPCGFASYGTTRNRIDDGHCKVFIEGRGSGAIGFKENSEALTMTDQEFIQNMRQLQTELDQVLNAEPPLTHETLSAKAKVKFRALRNELRKVIADGEFILHKLKELPPDECVSVIGVRMGMAGIKRGIDCLNKSIGEGD